MPSNIKEAKIDPELNLITNNYTIDIINEGVIRISYSNLNSDVNGKTILLTPDMEKTPITWDCLGGTMPSDYRPSNCRK